MAAAQSLPPAVVQTETGSVTGQQTARGGAYFGVPYAQPPVKSLRRRPPVPPVPCSAPRDTTRTGATYAYEFRDPDAATTLSAPADLGTLSAFHAGEIAYIFQTPNAAANPLTFTPQQQALSDRMQAAWGSFARTGTPGTTWAATPPGALQAHTFTPEGDATDLTFSPLHHCGFWHALHMP